MAAEQMTEGSAGEYRLPLEFRTVLTALRLKFMVLVALAVVSAGFGISAALYFGTQNFEASTVLIYQPIDSFVTDSFRIYQGVGQGTDLSYEHGAGLVKVDTNARTLASQVNLVKIPPNLEALRQDLELNRTLEQIGAVIDVKYSNTSSLMTITARSESSLEAMIIANRMRDIFLANADRMVRQELQDQGVNLKRQYQSVREDLVRVQQEFTDFIQENGIRDMQIETQRVAGELVSLELSLPQNERRIEILELQIKRIEQSLAEAAQESQNAQDAQQALQDSAELESAAQRAVTATSGEYSALTDYIKLASLKLLEAQMELISARLTHETDLIRYEDLSRRHTGLPEISQKYTVLAGRLAALEAEARGLEKVLNQFELVTVTDFSDFYVVSEAVEPLYPAESNRRLIALAVTAVTFIIGFALVLLAIVLDTRLRSVGDAAQKLHARIIGEFPAERAGTRLLPTGKGESVQIERYRILARPLRRRYSGNTMVLLIASTTRGEGKSTVALNLAAVYGRQDERVLLIDAQVRRSQLSSPFRSLLPEQARGGEHKPLHGLGEYLSYQVFDYEEIVHSTNLPGVAIIVGREEAVIPDLLQSARMEELMEQLKEQYTVIIIEGPPVEESVDSEILSGYADTLLLVAACGTLVPDKIRQALKRLIKAECPVEGVVLNKVQPAYLS
jgi:polysaccharide biosynthesis transport protein